MTENANKKNWEKTEGESRQRRRSPAAQVENMGNTERNGADLPKTTQNKKLNVAGRGSTMDE